jgi:ABC-2 type transport system permease protein
MIAILKRELRAYFHTPVGYVFLAVYLAVAGAVFAYTTLFSLSADVAPFFSVMIYVAALLLPLLTMRLFSEDKRQKTEQLLLTSPVSVTGMVAGKYLAAFTLFFGAHTLTSCYFLILYRYAAVKTALLLGNYVAVLLGGMAFLAVGVFVSALTESQLSAAVGTIGILAAFLGLSLLGSLFGDYSIRYVFDCISLFSRFSAFSNGIFDLAALLYYLTFTALFLFLTVRVYLRRHRV